VSRGDGSSHGLQVKPVDTEAWRKKGGLNEDGNTPLTGLVGETSLQGWGLGENKKLKEWGGKGGV